MADENIVEEEELNPTIQDSMTILMAAGEARAECKLAYDAIAAGDMALAEEKLKAADAKILEAHHVQTDHIQGAFRGEKQEYSLLFSHAQDTLMTIYSEIITAKQLYKVFAAMDERLRKLEEA